MALKVVTAKEMKALDRFAIKECGIPSIVLMENAGLRIFDELIKQFPDLQEKKVVVIAGKGNNGGDGFVVARHFHNHKISVKIFLLGKRSELKKDAKINATAAINIGLKPTELDESNIKECSHELSQATIIIDAIFGTGIKPPVTGFYAQAIEMINSSERPIVAIDIPSGIDSDTGNLKGPHVKASATMTLALLKRSHMLYPAAEAMGKISIVDISLPQKAIDSQPIPIFLTEEKDVASMFSGRKEDSHKGTYGHVLILAGSKGKGGAAGLAGLAALRSGAGLVTVAVPENCQRALEFNPLEIMTIGLPENKDGHLSPAGIKQLLESLSGKSVLAIGPGISTNPDTLVLLEEILPTLSLPLIIDADGLNCLALSKKLWSRLPNPTILTPHPKEMSRLTGIDIKNILADKIKSAQSLVLEKNIYLILKGAHSLISSPDSSVFINPTGNPGLATGGSGDVLTGIVAGFIAQGLDPRSSCVAACYVHGLAGDLLAEKTGQRSLIAGDLLDSIPSVIKRIFP